MKKLLSMCAALFVLFQATSVFADEQADHNALRTLREQATTALNANNFDQLTPLLDKNFKITTVDNHQSNNLAEFKSYWENLFKGKDAVLKSIEMNPTADALTEFLSPDVGVVYGTSADVYHFTDGDTRRMNDRWSAIVKRNPDGWKIVSVHFSANLLDNPLLNSMKQRLCWYGFGGLLIGIIIGMFLSSCCRNRTRTP